MSLLNRILGLLSKDHLSAGINQFENGEYRNAIEQFEKAISQDPDPASQNHKLAKFYITESYIALADKHNKEGDKEAAREFYLKVTDFNDYADVFLKIAKIYFEEGDYNTAEEYVIKSLKASSRYLKAKLFLCIIGLKQNKIEETMDYLIELVFESIYENLEKLETAIEKIREEDIDTAINLLQNITVDKPSEWLLLVKQGDSLCAEGDYESALDRYNKALELKGEYPDYHFRKGSALLELKRYDEAIKSFNDAVKINPDYINAWISLGAAYLLKNDVDNASAQFNMVLKIDPDNKEALLSLKEILKDS